MSTPSWKKPAAFRVLLVLGVAATILGAAAPASTSPKKDAAVQRADVSVRANRALPPVEPPPPSAPSTPRAAGPVNRSNPAAAPAPATTESKPLLEPQELATSAAKIGVFAFVSLAPVAVLMVTGFVRINIVLVLLRQALGSPQVPGNQILTALALLLTALVMRPTAEAVYTRYTRAIEPVSRGAITWQEAYSIGAAPIKSFMLDQIAKTGHERYLWKLSDEVMPESFQPEYLDEYPMRVVAPAFLLSEITTALVIGFYLYLPFLVVDLVVSAALAAMGLFMLPPALVALPLKLILFVAVDGWLHVATMLLRSFGPIA
jgi:flagellar biosynthesis protein FliP